jgi:hypothetical protein
MDQGPCLGQPIKRLASGNAPGGQYSGFGPGLSSVFGMIIAWRSFVRDAVHGRGGAGWTTSI